MNGGRFNGIKPGNPIFFGPFIGEFGWELAYWQGWVKRVCGEFFENNQIIVSSRPGYSILYPYAHEFWPLPSWFSEMGRAPNQYVTAGWRHGLPGEIQWRQNMSKTFADGIIKTEYIYEPSHMPFSLPDIQPMAEVMLSEFKARLPEETVYFVPWKLNTCPISGNEFGIRSRVDANETGLDFELLDIKPEFQEFRRLSPTRSGVELLDQIVGSRNGEKFIAVHPRCRDFDSARNWDERVYIQIISKLQNLFPSHTIVLYGSPGGTYFNVDVPEGCIDLINIDTRTRLDVHIAALNKSWFALGSRSGGLSLAYQSGCPVITELDAKSEVEIKCFLEHMNVPILWTSDMGGNVDEILQLAMNFAAQSAH